LVGSGHQWTAESRDYYLSNYFIFNAIPLGDIVMDFSFTEDEIQGISHTSGTFRCIGSTINLLIIN
jgi:hypothetical protein